MNKKGILIIAHGSRAKETISAMDTIFDYVSSLLPDIIMQQAYMEFCDVNLEKGLDILVDKGVNDIVVVPYFLFEGIHIRKDIPEEIKKYTETRKGIKISMGKVLGSDKRIGDVLADRIRQAL